MTETSHWTVLTVSADVPVREIISAYLSEYCLGAIDQEINSQYFFNPEKKSSIEAVIQELQPNFSFTWDWAIQNREDWHLAWQDSFKPIFITDKLAVIPDWDNQTKAQYTIRIKPGNAFGTGHHETTAMVLQQLCEVLTPGMSVLDVGTGSGILAIGAKLLGAGDVTCLENDSSCEANFYENVHLNGLDNQLVFTVADVLEWTDFSLDLLMINVNRNVILNLMPIVTNTTGLIILTGILISDIELVSKCCIENQFKVIAHMSQGEWASLRIQKNKELT